MSRFFERANPYALAAIRNASESCEHDVVEDIFDQAGVKLWTKGRCITSELFERLSARPLRRPIEQCIAAREGVTATLVSQTVADLFEQEPYLAALADSEASTLCSLAVSLELQPAAALLLTSVQASANGGFRHACLAAALSGAIALRCGLGLARSREVMLAGLLHDVGELYVNPAYLANLHELTPAEWQHVAVHPRIGELFVTQNTTYPQKIAKLVGYHQERLDGSGYPYRVTKDRLCEAAGTVIVAETLAGPMNRRDNVAARAALGLSLVPGEYPAPIVSLLVALSRRFPVTAVQARSFESAKASLAHAKTSLALAQQALAELKASIRVPLEASVLSRAALLIRRLETAFASTGAADFFELTNQSHGDGDPDLVFQLELVPSEVRWRMRNVARDVAFDCRDFLAAAKERMAPLLKRLEG